MKRRPTQRIALQLGEAMTRTASLRFRIPCTETILQAGRMGAWRAWRTFDGGRVDFKRWLSTCVYWAVREEWRRQLKLARRERERGEVPLELLGDSFLRPAPADEYADVRVERVRQAVAGLPLKLRRVIERRFWHQQTLAEIAEAMGCAVNTVFVAEQKAMRLLFDALN